MSQPSVAGVEAENLKTRPAVRIYYGRNDFFVEAPFAGGPIQARVHALEHLLAGHMADEYGSAVGQHGPKNSGVGVRWRVGHQRLTGSEQVRAALAQELNHIQYSPVDAIDTAGLSA